MPLLLALAACRAPDPRLARWRAALEAWEEGRAAAAEGRWEDAAGAFGRAFEADPASPALAWWRATALDRSGRPGEALALLDAALGAAPDAAGLRRLRAALRARAGDPAGALADLRRLEEGGLLDPWEAGGDPDLARLAGLPGAEGLVLLPRLRAELRARQPRVLLGDPWTVRLVVGVPGDAPPALSGPAPAGLRLSRVVEDLVDDAQALRVRELEATWVALAPGAVRAGPWTVRAGDEEVALPAAEVEVIAVGSSAPPGDAPPPLPAALAPFPVPSRLLGDRPLPWVGAVDGAALVAWRPGCRASLAPEPALRPVRLELRRHGQPRALARLWPAGAAAGVRVRVECGDGAVAEAVLP